MHIWDEEELGRENNNNNSDCFNYSYTRWARFQLSLHSRHRIWAEASTWCALQDWSIPEIHSLSKCRVGAGLCLGLVPGMEPISLTWKLCLWKRKTSHQQSAALDSLPMSLQLLNVRGTFMFWREQSSNLTCLSPSETLLEVDGSVCSCYLLSPEPSSFFSFLSVLFQGCISQTNLSLAYPTWVQPALLLTGHIHTQNLLFQAELHSLDRIIKLHALTLGQGLSPPPFYSVSSLGEMWA